MSDQPEGPMSEKNSILFLSSARAIRGLGSGARFARVG
jgi:hypothetical protein